MIKKYNFFRITDATYGGIKRRKQTLLILSTVSTKINFADACKSSKTLHFFFVGIFICMVYYANKKGRFNFMLYESHTIILHYILYLYIMNCSLSSCFYFLRVSIFFVSCFILKYNKDTYEREIMRSFLKLHLFYLQVKIKTVDLSHVIYINECVRKRILIFLFVCFFPIVIQKHGSYSLYLLLLFLYRVSDKMMK